MADINNSYKRFQTYTNSSKANAFKQDYMEQNYKVEKKSMDDKREETRKDLSKPDTSFLQRSTHIGVNNKGSFFKK